MSTGSQEGMGALSMAYSMEQNEKARDTYSYWTGQALAAQKEMYNQTREDLAPYRELGSKSSNVIADLMGLNGTDAQTTAFNNFRSDPGYQYSVDTANKQLTRSALAKGNLFSGNFLAASNTMNQGLADQQYSNYYNRLYNLSSLGSNAAAKQANANQTYASAVSSLDTQMGQITSNYFLNNAAAFQQAAELVGKGAQSTSDRVINTVAAIYGKGMLNTGSGTQQTSGETGIAYNVGYAGGTS